MTDVYLLNLAMSDLLFVFSLPFWSHYAAKSNWVFENFMCKTITGFYLIGFYSGIFFIVIMSIDRYMAIVLATSAMRFRSVSHGAFVSLTIWLVSLCASVPTIVFTQVRNESTGITCKTEFPEEQKTSWHLIMNFEINILGLLIPLPVMIFCYSGILQILKRCRNFKKVKAVKLIFIVVVVFFLFWMPYNIVIFLRSLENLRLLPNDYCDTKNHLDVAIQVTETLAFVHCCLNPVIYAFAGQEFKKCVRRLLQKWTSYCFICKNCKMLTTEISESGTSVYSRSSSDLRTTRVL
ncbi:CCR5 protein, partial [Atractosteus spatula]|nr:CCR5 protein [Atractosteus spatula]